MPKRRKRPSQKGIVRKRVNKKGYITKSGKKVGPYNRTMNVYPNPHFAYRMINGKKRICKIYKEKGKVSVQVVEDKRQVQRIEQSRKVKLKYPYRRTMVKELPDNLAKGVKEIGKDDYEHSIAIDFERDLKQPQRMAVVEGGESQTLKIDDFEIYGHSHPDATYPRPSNADLRNIRYLKPEFIVAGKSGRIQIYNIEDPQQYEKWKQAHDYVPNSNAITYDDLWKLSRRKKYKNLPDHFKINPYNYSETELGREMFFDITGIKIYPYRKGTVIEMQDDPRYEKKMPSVPQHYQEKYHKQRKMAERKAKNSEQPKRAYTTKADKTHNRINKEYNWIAMRYLGKDKMTPDDRINHLKYQIEAIEELREDTTLSKKVIDTELETKRKRLKMEYHYGMGPPTPGEYGIS